MLIQLNITSIISAIKIFLSIIFSKIQNISLDVTNLIIRNFLYLIKIKILKDKK